jgi:16S rRNA (cytosine967-C5)-methyltransferase
VVDYIGIGPELRAAIAQYTNLREHAEPPVDFIDNAIPPLTLRVNRQKTSVAAVLAELAQRQTEAEPSAYLPEAIRVTGSLWLEDFPPYRAGQVSVQDESGMLVAFVAHPGQGERVLDMAAGLGGKSTHLLEADPTVKVVAVDRSQRRLAALAQNARRLGVERRLEVVHDDVRHFIGAHEPEAFQTIILDAPCTGLGVLRRRVDGRWKKEASDLNALTRLQRDLLAAAWQGLAPGGGLVYSTCSVEPEETVEQMAWAIDALSGARLDSVASYLPSQALKPAVDQGMLSVFPGQFGMDGFFIARLIKPGLSGQKSGEAEQDE